MQKPHPLIRVVAVLPRLQSSFDWKKLSREKRIATSGYDCLPSSLERVATPNMRWSLIIDIGNDIELQAITINNNLDYDVVGLE